MTQRPDLVSILSSPLPFQSRQSWLSGEDFPSTPCPDCGGPSSPDPDCDLCSGWGIVPDSTVF